MRPAARWPPATAAGRSTRARAGSASCPPRSARGSLSTSARTAPSSSAGCRRPQAVIRVSVASPCRPRRTPSAAAPRVCCWLERLEASAAGELAQHVSAGLFAPWRAAVASAPGQAPPLGAVRERARAAPPRLVDRVDVVDRDHEWFAARDRQQEVAQRGLQVRACRGHARAGRGSACPASATRAPAVRAAARRALPHELGQRLDQLLRPARAPARSRPAARSASARAAPSRRAAWPRARRRRASASGRCPPRPRSAALRRGLRSARDQLARARSCSCVVAPDQRRRDQVRAR